MLVMIFGIDMGPLPINPSEKGSRFAPAMGLEGAVCRCGSYWYESESDSEVVWPYGGEEGYQEWS